MNRCEEVLKHSINKGLKIEKDELYHSDTYLGSEYDEGLKHWKYIKKYKNSKGKTVYVYANKGTHNFLKTADENADLDKRASADALYESKEYAKKADRILDHYETANANDKYNMRNYVNIARSQNAKAKGYARHASYLSKRKEYLIEKNDVKQKIKNVGRAVSSIHKDAVTRTTNFIGRTLSKVNKKVNSIKRETVVTGFKFISSILK